MTEKDMQEVSLRSTLDFFEEMNEREKAEAKYWGILADFSIALVNFRTRNGFTQEELAEILSVKKKDIKKYENGTSGISLRKLNEICGILGIGLKISFTDGENKQ